MIGESKGNGEVHVTFIAQLWKNQRIRYFEKQLWSQNVVHLINIETKQKWLIISKWCYKAFFPRRKVVPRTVACKVLVEPFHRYGFKRIFHKLEANPSSVFCMMSSYQFALFIFVSQVLPPDCSRVDASMTEFLDISLHGWENYPTKRHKKKQLSVFKRNNA